MELKTTSIKRPFGGAKQKGVSGCMTRGQTIIVHLVDGLSNLTSPELSVGQRRRRQNPSSSKGGRKEEWDDEDRACLHVILIFTLPHSSHLSPSPPPPSQSSHPPLPSPMLVQFTSSSRLHLYYFHLLLLFPSIFPISSALSSICSYSFPFPSSTISFSSIFLFLPHLFPPPPFLPPAPQILNSLPLPPPKLLSFLYLVLPSHSSGCSYNSPNCSNCCSNCSSFSPSLPPLLPSPHSPPLPDMT